MLRKIYKDDSTCNTDSAFRTRVSQVLKRSSALKGGSAHKKKLQASQTTTKTVDKIKTSTKNRPHYPNLIDTVSEMQHPSENETVALDKETPDNDDHTYSKDSNVQTISVDKDSYGDNSDGGEQ